MEHLKIVRKLCQNDFDTFIVGGAVRDILNGETPTDLDIVTKATPDEIEEIFKDHNVKTVGKSFGVVLVDGFEVATFRTDTNYKVGAKCCGVEFADHIDDDLSRRDLTINSMALCEITGELIDNFNGQSDLKNKIIRFTGDPNQRLHEDPARAIRACRFLAKIDGAFEKESFDAIVDNVELICEHVVSERIRMEVIKAMSIKRASVFFRALHITGLLKFIFPSLDSCYGHPHGNYHTENVFEHMMIAGDSMSTKDPILKLAAYLHDVGKPESYDDGKFIGHEIVGAEILQFELSDLKFSISEVDRIISITRMHMRSLNNIKPKGVRKLLKKLSDSNVDVDDFMRIKIADRCGNLAKPNFTISEIKSRHLMMYGHQELPMRVIDLNISGGDLIKYFKLKPGKIVGEIQRELLNRVIESGSDINQFDVLLSIAGEIVSRKM